MKTDENEASFLRSRAFKEGVAVFIAVGLLGMIVLGMLLPGSRPIRSSKRINCLNNLKQVGLGLRMWSNDSTDKLPMQVSTNDGGTKDWVGSSEVYRHFLAASNEISDPKVLICPADSKRSAVTSFASLHNQNLSYFIELNAQESLPMMMLTGDRHLSSNDIALPNGCYLISTQQVLGWGPELHGTAGGNVGLTDGSVQRVGVTNLTRLRASQQIATNWLAIP
jgi:hypothetical protein